MSPGIKPKFPFLLCSLDGNDSWSLGNILAMKINCITLFMLTVMDKAVFVKESVKK